MQVKLHAVTIYYDGFRTSLLAAILDNITYAYLSSVKQFEFEGALYQITALAFNRVEAIKINRPPVNGVALDFQPKILILGHGEHGKGTFSKLLCKRFNLKSMSSSFAALPYIFPTLQNLHGYKTPEEAHADRMNHRILWRDLIALFNSPDKATLANTILKQSNIYDGMRDVLEFNATFEKFDFIFWVDASQRLPNFDESLNISFDPLQMFLIDNNGTEEHLEEQVNNITSLQVNRC